MKIAAATVRSGIGVARLRPLLLAGASLLLAFAVWQLLSSFVFNPFLIPPPLEVIRTAIPMLRSGEIHCVRDGHHRVSVACALGWEEIDAYVTEVVTRVGAGRTITMADLPSL